MVIASSVKQDLGRYVGLDEQGGQATVFDPKVLQRIIGVKLAARRFEDTSTFNDEILDVA